MLQDRTRRLAHSRWLLPACAAVVTLIGVPGTLASTVTYQYDELGRVTSVDYDSFVRDTYVYDAANNRTQKQTAYVDTVPPSAPGAISLTNLTQTTVDASWAPASDNTGVTTYQYRLNASPTWTTLGNFTSLNLTGLSPGTAYVLDVRAKDAVENAGPASSASFTTNGISAVTISNRNVVTQHTGGARATYTLSLSGAILASQAKSSATVSIGTWLTPQVGMSGFEARATLTSSTACNGSPLGAWLNLGSSVSWYVNAPTSQLGLTTGCTVTLQIRHTSNPSAILGSAQISLVAVNAP